MFASRTSEPFQTAHALVSARLAHALVRIPESVLQPVFELPGKTRSGTGRIATVCAIVTAEVFAELLGDRLEMRRVGGSIMYF
jgi:hypothetical protein